VLKTHNLDAAFVQRPRHIRVVGLDVASNAMSDFGRVWARLVGRVKGHDLTFADRGGQVVRERGDAAPARGVRGNEGGSRDEVLQSGIARAWGRASDAARNDCRPGPRVTERTRLR